MSEETGQSCGLSEQSRLVISLLRLTIALADEYRDAIEKDIQRIERDHHEPDRG